MERATILKRSDACSVRTAEVDSSELLRPSQLETVTVMPAALVRGRAEADALLEVARTQAAALLADAHAQIAASAQSVQTDAEQRAAGIFAARYIQVREREERAQALDLDRTLALAVLLAERLVGEAIVIDPERLRVLAESAIGTARGARSGRIEANPHDLAYLETLMPPAVLGTFKLEPNLELGRGSLILHTDVGQLDARVSVQLSHLAETLRAALTT
jgi:flagellar biosynthesis/type III secretory pathway protein FliH